MAAYIRGIGSVSPVWAIEDVYAGRTPAEQELAGPAGPACYAGVLRCVDPDYKKFIDPQLLRRMNRLVKRGIFTASRALSDAGIDAPGAIIMGTGMGCLEDTGKFLTGMISSSERALNPTYFINSTHNTISSQIAIFLKCHGYNATYSHRGFSFESALLDSILLLEEGEASHVLVGGLDELTEEYYHIRGRLGHWKKRFKRRHGLLRSTTKGTVAGEGAALFCLSSEHTDKAYARLSLVDMMPRADNYPDVANRVRKILAGKDMGPADIDMMVCGLSGDSRYDRIYYELGENLFKNARMAYFKHLCGEYFTASAFALWLCAQVVKNQTVPHCLLVNPPGASPGKPRQACEAGPCRNVLIYNHYNMRNHSFILISKC